MTADPTQTTEAEPSDDLLRLLAREAMSVGWYEEGFFRMFLNEDDDEMFSEADARYFAALSPAVVLGLLDRAALDSTPSSPAERPSHPDDGHAHSWGCRRCGVDPAEHGRARPAFTANREALIHALPGAFQLADGLGWDSDDFTDRDTLEAVADRLLGKDRPPKPPGPNATKHGQWG